MIVCSCFVVSDHQIKKAAQDGKPFHDFLHETNMGSNCGRCMIGAKQIYDQACPLKPDCKRYQKPVVKQVTAPETVQPVVVEPEQQVVAERLGAAIRHFFSRLWRTKS